MKRILITGGAGFIGSNLTKRLLDCNQYRVTCFDNFDPFYPKAQKELNIRPFLTNVNYSFVEGDIRSSNDLNQINGIDVIIHLAAKAGVRQSIENSRLYLDVNVMGTHNLLEFARAKGIKQFILGSSSSVYGVNPNFPWNEEAKLSPISPYASSKVSNELLGQVYSYLYGIRFLAIRFFTVYGPGQRPDLAIFKFFENIIQSQPISLFGDGNTYRDYTYIDDIVSGVIAAIEYDNSDYETINLGCGSPIRLNELVSKIEHVCAKKAIIKSYPDQPGDVFGTYADIAKAKKLLQYNPNTNLDKGLKAFYDWFTAENRIRCSIPKLIGT